MERTWPDRIIQTPRTRMLSEQAFLARRCADHHAREKFYFTGEQAYVLTPSGFQLVWMEVLTRILWRTDHEPFFWGLHAAWKSIPLAIAWLRWALMGIVSWRIKHPVSINVFIGDFMDSKFWKSASEILQAHRESDREMVEFELLEYWDPWKIDTALLAQRYKEMQAHGPSSAIDDFDVLWNNKHNISRILLKTLYPLWCRKIKLDWRTTRWLLAWDPPLVEALQLLLMEYPWLMIQAEWVRIDDNPQWLEEKWITQFQWSSYWDL